MSQYNCVHRPEKSPKISVNLYFWDEEFPQKARKLKLWLMTMHFLVNQTKYHLFVVNSMENLLHSQKAFINYLFLLKSNKASFSLLKFWLHTFHKVQYIQEIPEICKINIFALCFVLLILSNFCRGLHKFCTWRLCYFPLFAVLCVQCSH